jgi:FixJ family two-component response regulator
MTDPPLVLVLDDDASIRKALARLLHAAGMRVETFASPAEFLEYRLPEVPSCLVLDVELPGIDGLELQRRLSQDGFPLPIVFITGHGDIPMSVRAIKSGAVDFLPKPFHDEDLLAAVRQALERAACQLAARSDESAIRERLDSLSPREREVFAHVVSGELNKQIGRRLGVTEKTIKVHRGQVMRKMAAESLADLVRMGEKLGIRRPSDEGAQ